MGREQSRAGVVTDSSNALDPGGASELAMRPWIGSNSPLSCSRKDGVMQSSIA